jgi:hypothetical protein
MRRLLSGSVCDTSRALERFRALAGRLLGDSGPGLEGETVGNSPDGSPFGLVYDPLGSVGTDPGGTVLVGRLGSGDGDVVLAATTLMVAAEWNESAFLACTVAVSVICSPATAALRTNAPATSSSLWPVGSVPTEQTSPFDFGHTVNRGASTCATFPRVAVTLTPWASATVLQIQIA